MGIHRGSVPSAGRLCVERVDSAILERRPVIGGAAVTEEFHPGFRNSTASYTVSLLNPKIIADMNLAGHGLRIVERKLQTFLPLNEQEYLCVGGNRTRSEVAKFSPRDAQQLDAYGARLGILADLVRSILLTTPPNVTDKGWGAGLVQLIGAAGLGYRLAQLDMTARRDLLALFGQSAGDLLDGWFESDPIKAVLGFDSIVGTYASPYSPGS
ncbi:MAG: FAD-dependent oxidoreductase, partial [Acidimicrobiales bacterium]